MRTLKLIIVGLLTCALHAQVVGPGFVDYVTSAPSGACSQGSHQQNVLGSGDIYTCANGTWTKQNSAGSSGTVTNIATTSPITGGPITTTGTIACPTCAIGGTTNAASQFAVPYYSTSGSAKDFSGLAPPTANGIYQLVENVTASAAVAPTFSLAGIPINAQTGTTYTFLYSDRGELVTFSNGSAIAATLPQAGSTGFTSNFFMAVLNKGAGAVTITPTTSTISVNGITGAATFVVRQNQFAFIYSDGTNYFANSPFYAADGSQANPAYSFANQTGSGMYQSGGSPTFTRQGGDAMQITSTGIQIPGGKVFGWTASGIGSFDTALSRGAASFVEIGNGTAGDSSGLLLSGNKVLLTSDFTDSSASGLQIITGLSFALPNVAKNWSFHCSLTYSEATPIANDQFGVASLTTAATNLHAWAHVITTEGATAAQTTGDSGNITNTTPTSIVTFTPVGTGIKQAEIDGSIEVAGSGASTLQFYVTNGTAADVIVIKRDSYCRID